MLKYLLIVGCLFTLLPLNRVFEELNVIEATSLIVFHIVLMGLVANDIASWMKEKADFFNPKVLSAIFYWIKFILFNLFCISNDTILKVWYLPQLGSYGFFTIIGTYLVVGLGWLAFRVGLTHGTVGVSKSGGNFPSHAPLHNGLGVVPLLLIIFFIVIGIWGNIGYAGGWEIYLKQMEQPFTRTEEIISAREWGSTIYIVAKSFLPVGLTIFAYSLLMHFGFSVRRFIIFFLLAAAGNYFLNCATGGRTAVLQVVFFAVVIANKIRRLSTASLVISGSAIVFAIVLMGHIDAVTRYGGELSLVGIADGFEFFIGKYISAFPGVLRLYTDVELSGSYVNTIWPSLIHIWGGATPLIIEQYMRLYHGYPSNVIIGPAPELYLNYGWLAVVIGMLIIGKLTSIISVIYERHRDKTSLYSLIVILLCFQVAPMNTFNLSSLFKMFLLLNLCFYIALFVLWCQAKIYQR